MKVEINLKINELNSIAEKSAAFHPADPGLIPSISYHAPSPTRYDLWASLEYSWVWLKTKRGKKTVLHYHDDSKFKISIFKNPDEILIKVIACVYRF